MTHNLEHLHTGVWSFLDEAQEHRITRLYMPKRVAYERGNEALARMEHLLRHPPCSRMPSMLLYGDSDIGKTMIVDKFVRERPDICNEHGEIEARKILRLQMPSKPNDDKLYAQIHPRAGASSAVRTPRHGSGNPGLAPATSPSAATDDRRRGSPSVGWYRASSASP